MFTEHTCHKENILGRGEDAKGGLFIRGERMEASHPEELRFGKLWVP